jgi:hypothetical protein
VGSGLSQYGMTRPNPQDLGDHDPNTARAPGPLTTNLFVEISGTYSHGLILTRQVIRHHIPWKEGKGLSPEETWRIVDVLVEELPKLVTRENNNKQASVICHYMGEKLSWSSGLLIFSLEAVHPFVVVRGQPSPSSPKTLP